MEKLEWVLTTFQLLIFERPSGYLENPNGKASEKKVLKTTLHQISH